NPTGLSLTRHELQRLARFAAAHDLWLISDNAYYNYDFTPGGFVDVATLPGAAERTFSVYSCSKTYAMPGFRVGFTTSPPAMAVCLRKWALYSVYSLSTASQFAAYQALRTSADVLADYAARVKEARDIVGRELRIPATTVEGGFYAFLDLDSWSGDESEFVA